MCCYFQSKDGQAVRAGLGIRDTRFFGIRDRVPRSSSFALQFPSATSANQAFRRLSDKMINVLKPRLRGPKPGTCASGIYGKVAGPDGVMSSDNLRFRTANCATSVAIQVTVTHLLLG